MPSPAPLAPTQQTSPRRKPGAPWADALRFRQNNFDVIRLFLAILVLFGHCYPVARGPNRFDPLGKFTHGVCDLPYVAVDAFFMISGFLIAASWVQSKTFWSYLKKRIFRIYPGFIALWIVMLIVVPWSMHQRPSLDPVISDPMQILTFQDLSIPGAFPNNPSPGVINVSLWTISHEFRCYLLLPLLATVAFARRRRWIVLSVLLVSLVAIALQPVNWQPPVDGTFIRYFGWPMDWSRFATCFLAGTTFYCYRDKIPWSPAIAIAAAIALAISFFNRIALLVALPTAGAYLLLWIAYAPRPLKHFARYGDFSYGVYLYAFLCQQLIVQKNPGIGPIKLFIEATPITLIAAIVSWYAVERWFLKTRVRKI